ncbi:MAG: hypothetical protein ABR511_10740 [Acidimicrobiales bacterium]
MELLLLILVIALVAGAVGGPRLYSRRPGRVVYDDRPVVEEVVEEPVVRRRRFF